MAAARVELESPVKITLATTLTRINPGDSVNFVLLSCESDVYLVYDDSLDDGAAVPANARFRIPANVEHPIPVTGTRMLIAASSGAPNASLFGLRG